MLKKSIIALYILIVVCTGFATILEKLYGSQFVSDNIYGSAWFIALWGLMVVIAIVYMLKKKLQRRPAVMMLHLSFVVILLGALTTHITAERGTIHLRKGIPAASFQKNDGTKGTLPFNMMLKDFEIEYYAGTEAAMNYKSIVEVRPDGTSSKPNALTISMNNIGECEGYRFFQSAYDSDGGGTILGVSYDPYGIAITYLGYLLFLISVLWTLYAQKTVLSQLYRKATKPLVCLLLLLCSTTVSEAKVTHEVSPEIAHKIGTIIVLYHDRLCPLNTAAVDFVTKLTGKSSWEGYSADEIFVGWMIYYTEWEDQKIIRIKNSDVQHILGINDDWASMHDFYTPQGDYKLQEYLNPDAQNVTSTTFKAIREADEKLRTVTIFYNSDMLHIFPLKVDGRLQWFTPGSTELPKNIPDAEFQFIKHSMDYLVQDILVDDTKKASTIIAKIKLYQKDKAGSLLPSSAAVKTEIFYNSLLYARWIVFLVLTSSLVYCLCYLFGLRIKSKVLSKIPLAGILGGLFFVYLSILLGLRWWISGHLPMSNGCETMLFMSWITILLTLCSMHKIEFIKAFGPLLASLCLLVAMLASGTPQITQLMPVLQSPLLSIHVMVIMASYSLFALMTLLSLQYLVMSINHKQSTINLERQTALSELLLYPAIFLLGIGIFIGAIWANVSWGNYWSWDPKEVWALITFMVYAAPLHSSLKWLQKERNYHLYVLLAFLTVLMTYFGVNYYLSGMHSYA